MAEETITTQEHFSRAARTGQEAMSTAVRTWGEAMQSMLGLTGGRGPAQNPVNLVERWFDSAEEALQAQHEFMEGLITLGRPTLTAMARAAQETSDVIQHPSQPASQQPSNVRTARSSRTNGG